MISVFNQLPSDGNWKARVFIGSFALFLPVTFSACGNGGDRTEAVGTSEVASALQSDPAATTPTSIDYAAILPNLDTSDPNQMIQDCLDANNVPYQPGGEVDGEVGIYWPDLEPAQQALADQCSDAVAAAMEAANPIATTTAPQE